MNKKTLLALLAAMATPFAHAQAQDKQETAATVNAAVTAKLTVDGKSVALKGRVQTQLAFQADQLTRGEVRLSELNLTLFGLDNQLITGRTAILAKSSPLGVVQDPGTRATLRFDANKRVAQGDVAVLLDFAQLDELFEPKKSREPREDDFFQTERQPGKLHVALQLDKPLATTTGRDIRTGSLSIKLEADPVFDASGLQIVRGYRIELVQTQIPIDIFTTIQFEAGRRLCIQPVRIRSHWFDIPTGLGLDFGMPGARKEWGKADITFEVRDWITITNSAWKVASESEESAIRASVNVDDCIEVFFVQNFSPESLHGGGATWGSGTANAKIITSDGNATFGVDLTHLAHELGHVLNMGHPGSPGSLYNASTNTLMCPSGWHNDNPKRNSLANKTNASNPLLTNVIKIKGPAPDCTNSATCGACP